MERGKSRTQEGEQVKREGILTKGIINYEREVLQDDYMSERVINVMIMAKGNKINRK